MLATMPCCSHGVWNPDCLKKSWLVRPFLCLNLHLRASDVSGGALRNRYSCRCGNRRDSDVPGESAAYPRTPDRLDIKVAGCKPIVVLFPGIPCLVSSRGVIRSSDRDGEIYPSPDVIPSPPSPKPTFKAVPGFMAAAEMQDRSPIPRANPHTRQESLHTNSRHSPRGNRIGIYKPGQLRRKHGRERPRERCVHVVLVAIDWLPLHFDLASGGIAEDIGEIHYRDCS